MVPDPKTRTMLEGADLDGNGSGSGDDQLIEEYSSVMEVFRIGWYRRNDPDPVICNGGDTPCMTFVDSQDVQKLAHDAGRLARFFARLVLWAVRRLTSRALRRVVKQRSSMDKDFRAPALDDVTLMIGMDRHGRRTLLLGMRHDEEHGHSPALTAAMAARGVVSTHHR